MKALSKVLYEAEKAFVMAQSVDLFTKIISQSGASILTYFLHSAILKWSFTRECHCLQLLPVGTNHVYLQRRHFGLTFVVAFLSNLSLP